MRRAALTCVLLLGACAGDDSEWRVFDAGAASHLQQPSVIGVGERIWVSGNSADTVATVYFDGATWTRLDQPVQPIWPASASDFWRVTPDSVLQRSDDAIAWTTVDLAAEIGAPVDPPFVVFGSGPDDVWVITYATVRRLYHHDGVAWTENTAFAALSDGTFFGGCSTGPDDLWLTGISPWYEGMVRHWDGSAWTTGGLPEVFGEDEYEGLTCRGSDVWLQRRPIGSDATTLRRTGDSWTTVELSVPHTSQGFLAVAAPGDAWVPGTECDAPCDGVTGTAQIWHVQDDVATATLQDDLASANLFAAWTTASGRTFVFGDDLVLEHVE